MKKLTLIAIVLCSFLLAPSNYDSPLAIRFITWCVITILMVVCAKNFKIGVIHIFAVGFLLSVLWSGVFAVNRSEWIYWALRAFLAVIFLSVAEINAKSLAKTMMCLGVVFIIYFWYEYFKTGQFEGMSGLMRQHNYWAAAHFFVIVFCCYGVWKKFAFVLVPLLVFNIIMLNSRSTIAALVTSACVVILINKKLRWYLVGIGVIVGICLTKTSAYNYDSLHQRFEQWVPTLQMIWEHPFGVGAGNWWILFPKYAPAMDFPNAFSQVSFRFPHNDFLWVCAEMGIIGLICYLGMFAVALKQAKKLYLVMGLSGFMAMAFFTACRERPFASLMMMVLIVLACKRYDKIKCIKTSLIPLTLLLVVLGFQYRSSMWNRKLASAQSFSQKIIMTEGYSVFTTLTYTGMPYMWWRGMSNYKLGNKELALNQFEIAYRQNPTNVYVLNAKGISMVHQGKPSQAKGYFQEALRISPAFIDARLNLEKFK